MCITMAWRYRAADLFTAMCASTRVFKVVRAATWSQRRECRTEPT